MSIVTDDRCSEAADGARDSNRCAVHYICMFNVLCVCVT